MSAFIEKSPKEMLPTVDDLGADWAEGGGDSPANQILFVNTQSQSSVSFRVSVFETTSGADSEMSARRDAVREEGFGTDDLEVGEGSFLYKPGDDIIFNHFRTLNMVAEARYFGGAEFTPESTAIDLAELLADTITE